MEDVTEPRPGPDELLVEVRSAGLNGGDRRRLSESADARAHGRSIPAGLELAGVVVDAGTDASRHWIGEAVMGIVASGAQAELALIAAAEAIRVPSSLTWDEAGSVPETFTVAHDALFTQAQLKAGERVLVRGGAGGVGLAAIQLGVAAGASVSATVRTAGLAVELARLGAQVVDPAEPRENAYDVIVELLGAPYVPADIASLRTAGRLCVLATMTGSSAEIDFRALMNRRARILCSTFRARSPHERAAAARRVEAEVIPLFADGRLRALVDSVFELDEAAAAYERLAQRGRLGKVVLSSDRFVSHPSIRHAN